MSEEPLVSNNGKRKRQRVSQACERCRAKKYRCDGAGPPCAACHTADTACIYGQAGQRRGLKTGYVKVLEMLWGLVLKKVPNSEYVATQLLATLSRENMDSNGQLALQAWRDSDLPSSIASLLDDEPLNSQESIRTPFLASPWILDPANDPQERTTADSRARTSTSEPSILPVDNQIAPPRIDQPTTSPALPPEWHLLLQAYLSYEESWLPILPKSAIWRIAYAYEASRETSSDHDLHARGDVATLWAALMLGELHMNGAISMGIESLQTRAHALLTPISSSEPDVSYAPAFLLWSVVHMGRREFTLAKMKLVQAHVLTDSHLPSIPNTDGGSLSTNACFVMDVLLALATKSEPFGIGSSSPAAEIRECELTDWEPFIDPLRQQQNVSNATSSLQTRPSRTYSTYNQFLKLCTLLYTVSQGNHLSSDLENSFKEWSACLPSHPKFGNSINLSDQDPRLPSEVNMQIVSMLFRSHLAVSGNDAPIHNAPLTYDKPTGTETLTALSSLQQQWDIGRLPLSFGVVLHLISMNVANPADPSLEDTLPLVRKLVANFAAHYAWRWPQNDREPTMVTNSNSTINASLSGNFPTQTTALRTNPMSITQQITGTSSHQSTTQQHSENVENLHAVRSDQTRPSDNQSTMFGEPDFGYMANGDLPDPMISDRDDSLFPGAYLDLFDSDERYVRTESRHPRCYHHLTHPLILHSGNRDFMRALGFLEDTDGLGASNAT
jgi:hypothetical protein